MKKLINIISNTVSYIIADKVNSIIEEFMISYGYQLNEISDFIKCGFGIEVDKISNINNNYITYRIILKLNGKIIKNKDINIDFKVGE